MPPRKAPLKGSSLSQKARKPINRKPMISRPRPVTPEEREARRLVAERSGGMCELGILCSGGSRAADWSHRIGRAQLGPWNAANGGDACRPCHSWAQTHPLRARLETGWILRSTDDYRATPVLHAVHGWVVLDSAGGYRPTTERPQAA
jgi:hypothetical protein